MEHVEDIETEITSNFSNLSKKVTELSEEFNNINKRAVEKDEVKPDAKVETILNAR